MNVLWLAFVVSLACANPVKDCQECSNVKKPRTACGTDHQTYASRCHLHRASCLTGRKLGVLHNGNCTGLTCSKKDLDEFDDRLVNLTLVLFQKNVGDPHPVPNATLPASTPLPEPEPSLYSIRKTLVYWLFDRLDIVYDRFLSRKEFLELEDMPYVHCARAFFENRCDSNQDNEVSLHEWCICLGLDDAEIEPYNDECTEQGLAEFNDRLIHEFSSEYDQAGGVVPAAPSDFENPQPESEPRKLTVQKKFIYWKFDTLDTNPYSRYLDPDELNSLTRYLQRNIRPYGCANTFIRRCDVDSDSRIGLHEWCRCLGLDQDGNPVNVKPTAASDVCSLQPQPGPCKGAFPRYYYSPLRNKCLQFTYGGCKGNGNNFETSADCLKACSPTPKKVKDCSGTVLDDFNSQVLVFVDKLKNGTPTDWTLPPFVGDPKPEPEHQIFTQEKRLIYWLWDRLDVNPHDDVLVIQEVKGYLKELSAAITNRGQCVKGYFDRCDRNSDSKISLAEWCFCHGLDNRCPAIRREDFNRKILRYIETKKKGLPPDLTVPPFHGEPQPEPELTLKIPEKEMVYWMWDRLDIHPHDDYITKIEFHPYQTEIKIITPFACGDLYFSYCDRNTDSKISLSEWCFCHGLDNTCPADNRRRYNLNLLEYMRFKKQQTATVISVPPFVGVPEPEAEPRLKTPEKILVYWQWDLLDISPHDDYLIRAEVSSYLADVRVRIEPFGCGLDYFEHCDHNSDDRISLAEWCFCHGLDNVCPANNRRKFNDNVLDYILVKKSGTRINVTIPPFEGEPKPESEPRLKTPEKILIYWQWDRLDISPHDDYLTKQEVISYMDDVRVTIEPFGCGLDYFEHCDHNSDSRISLAEWCFCHGLDDTCPAQSRRQFNLNILDYIQLNKERTGNVTVPPVQGTPVPEPESEPQLKTPEKILIYWQWDLLDVSPHDDYLTESEVSLYVADVRTTVEPFGCGLNYFEHCDYNSDIRISLAEWCICHGLDNSCPADNRKRFNNNVLEYIRLSKEAMTGYVTVPPFEGEPQPEAEPRLKTAEKIMIYWQWDQLDISPHDDYLTRAETNSYMAIVRTNVEPLGCGLNYFEHCDKNADDRISLSEWCFCHGLDNTCPAKNRRLFNDNILEYVRLQKEGTNMTVTPPPFEGEAKPESEPRIKTPEKILIYWQWDLLDILPHDDYLTKVEVAMYMKKVKLIVEPFGCGLDYFEHCDRNSDSKISLSEWCFCHGLDNTCPVKSRSRFNLNILDHIKAKKEGFKGAYIMPPFEGDPQPEPEPQIKTPEKKLVYWMWDMLDIGPHDDYLTWQEVQEYLDEVRQVVEPFGCGISYWHHLDINYDGRISLKEWCYGHGLDPNMTVPSKAQKPLWSYGKKDLNVINKKGCSNISREWFNENLIAKIALSYFLSHPEQKCREPVPEPTNGTVPEPEAEPRIRTPVKKLVYWQWDQLDNNPHDEYLDHSEIDNYIKTVASKVCPYACAHDMFKYCDADEDDRISRHEWCYCLGQDNEPDPDPSE